MAISINGTTGVITGVSEGGLPDGSVNTADIKDLSITGDKLGTGSVSADKIGSGAVTSVKLDSGVTSSIDAKAPLSQPEFTGNYVKIPVGDTASRPSAQTGMIRFNTDTNSMEQYDGSNWTTMAKPPIISSLSYPGSQTAVDPDGGETITISGANFTSGVNVKFGDTYATSVTRTNSTSLSVVVPALSAGTYDVYVVNGDGMQATLSSGIEYNAAPTFTTASGSLGSIQNDTAITTITLVATETDGGAITYNVTTGALPTGLSLSGADITGTPTGYTAETTANFTVTATDDEGQTVDRAFSLTVLVGFYDYEITNSLMLEKADGETLNYTPSSGSTTTWTQSFWFKLHMDNTKDSTLQTLFGSVSNNFRIDLDALSHLRIYGYGPSLFSAGHWATKVRDSSQWYNLVFRFDSTQSTDSDRFTMWLNGVELPIEGEAPGSYAVYPNQNQASGWLNSSYEMFIGSYNGSGNSRISFADWHCVDGQALSATDFGKFKEGIWVPKAYTGTYGTNGFYLDFEGSFQNDKSGNGNNWGISSNLGGANQCIDSPTNNFATWNVNDHWMTGASDITIKEGARRTVDDGSNNWVFAAGTMAVSSGKWYWEHYIVSVGNPGSDQMGIMHANHVAASGSGDQPGDGTKDVYLIGGSGYIKNQGSTTNSWFGGFTDGDRIGFALDLDNGYLDIYKNGAHEGRSATGISGLYKPFVSEGFSSSFSQTVNFGQDSSFAGAVTRQNNADDNGYGDFYYSPPSGYLAMCQMNLYTRPTLNPQEHFKPVLYSGNGSTNTITGLGFQPDLVWIKGNSNSTNSGYSHRWLDVVRGTNSQLMSNTTEAEESAPSFSSFDTDGFTVTGSDNSYNASGTNYVAFCWKAGGTPVSNTNGSITSNVSANTDAGFSIVSYTGNGSSSATTGHGLSQRPDMVIYKRRDSAAYWMSYHDSFGNNDYIYLNDKGAAGNHASVGSIPTSTVLNLGDNTDKNASGGTYIAYCWHSVPGYSKIGHYWGLDNKGQYVHTGFRPAWVMVKALNIGNNNTSWGIWNNASDEDSDVESGRISFGPANEISYETVLFANLTSVAGFRGDGNNSGTYLNIDFKSNGFKLADGQTNYENNTTWGYKYLFIAFADTFGGFSRAK